MYEGGGLGGKMYVREEDGDEMRWDEMSEMSRM